MDTLLHDLRFAFRTLSRRTGFTAAAVLCLGLGIGANTAAFSVVHGILYRALPFDEPDRVVSLEAVSRERGVTQGDLTFADLEDLRGTGLFEGVAGADGRSVTLTGEGRAERVQGAAVTPGLFELLGEAPAMGRGFRPEEAAPAGFEEVVVISHSLWQRRFGGADAVGRTLRVNGRERVVVGVMGPGFRFPETEEIWLPLGAASATERRARFVWGVGRLAPGVDTGEATRRLGDLSARLQADFPESHRAWSFEVRPFRARFVHPMGRRLLQLMLGAVGFVLLIACANVANLLLARGVEREREIAVRTALGASRGQVVRQLLTEASALGLAGAAVGWLLAMWFVEWLVNWIPEDMAYWMRVEMDATMLLFTLGLALLTAVLFGTLPAFRLARSGALAGLGDRLVSRRGSSSLREILVASEVAISLVLLVGAGLLVHSFLRIEAADPGFSTTDVLSFRTTLAGDRYDPSPARAEFYQSAVEAIAALPGVDGATVTSAIPADDGGPLVGLALLEETPPEERVNATLVVSTGGFFGALGVELLAGRELTASEVRDTAADVAVVGESLARRLWPAGGALGRRVHVAGDGWFRVVGVADDFQYEEFGEETPGSRLQIHLPYGVAGWRSMSFLVRAAGDPAEVSAAVRATLEELDPDLAPWDVLTMDERLRIATWPQRFFAFLFMAYGLIALVLALTGVYGVVAYEVGRRRREIGVRMALGASRSLVTREVVLRAGRLVTLGVVVGVAGAALVSRGMRGVLYGVGETDPSAFVGAALLMAATGLLAGYLPARRVARLEPSDALRPD